jgi:hypothetical protein
VNNQSLIFPFVLFRRGAVALLAYLFLFFGGLHILFFISRYALRLRVLETHQQLSAAGINLSVAHLFLGELTALAVPCALVLIGLPPRILMTKGKVSFLDLILETVPSLLYCLGTLVQSLWRAIYAVVPALIMTWCYFSYISTLQYKNAQLIYIVACVLVLGSSAFGLLPLIFAPLFSVAAGLPPSRAVFYVQAAVRFKLLEIVCALVVAVAALIGLHRYAKVLFGLKLLGTPLILLADAAIVWYFATLITYFLLASLPAAPSQPARMMPHVS